MFHHKKNIYPFDTFTHPVFLFWLKKVFVLDPDVFGSINMVLSSATYCYDITQQRLKNISL